MIKKCLVEKAHWFNPNETELLFYEPVKTDFSSFEECVSFYEKRQTFKNEYNIVMIGNELYISNSFHGQFAWMVRFFYESGDEEENNIRLVPAENQF